MKKIPLLKKSGRADVKAILLNMNKKQRHAVLATDAGGQPYTSLVAYALSHDAKGIIFATPKKTSKYKNILKNRKVSLMIDTRSNSSKGYMQSEAVTILGTAAPIRKGKKRDDLCSIFQKKHPELTEFIYAASTSIIYVTINKAFHASRFQAVTVWEPVR
jgi:nitroimidazol reductase NimA-like FMN-containing flavoprotein (pyridoxamine 5'-phosphate oxidase superfamily)